MLRHIVLLRWNEAAPPDVVDQMGEALGALAAQWPNILSYRYGPDAEVTSDTWDYAIVADFESDADFVEFRDDSDHRAMVKKLIVPWRGERASLQFRLSP